MSNNKHGQIMPKMQITEYHVTPSLRVIMVNLYFLNIEPMFTNL